MIKYSLLYVSMKIGTSILQELLDFHSHVDQIASETFRSGCCLMPGVFTLLPESGRLPQWLTQPHRKKFPFDCLTPVGRKNGMDVNNPGLFPLDALIHTILWQQKYNSKITSKY